MVCSALSIPLLRGWLGRRDTLLPWGPREGPNSSEFFLLQKFFCLMSITGFEHICPLVKLGSVWA